MRITVRRYIGLLQSIYWLKKENREMTAVIEKINRSLDQVLGKIDEKEKGAF